MDNVQDTKPQSLNLDQAQDAILAKWQVPDDDDQQTETETIAPEPEIVEETDEGVLEIEDDEDDVVDQDDETDPDDEEVEPEEDEEEYDDADEEEKAEAKPLDDEQKVEVLVDGETKSVSVRALKRLYGQEASLTRKSQEVSQAKKDAQAQIERTHVTLQRMLEKAQEAYKPYAEVDMLVASKTMSDQDFTALRKEAQLASDNLKFLSEEADSFYSDLKAKHQEALQKQAQECVKVLQEDIQDWSNSMYNDIRSYAVSQGLSEEEVNQYVDPNVIKLLNKAMLYDQGKRKAAVKKKKPSAKKVLRSKKAPQTANEAKRQSVEKKRQKVRSNRGQSLDDVTDLILSRWEK